MSRNQALIHEYMIEKIINNPDEISAILDTNVSEPSNGSRRSVAPGTVRRVAATLSRAVAELLGLLREAA